MFPAYPFLTVLSTFSLLFGPDAACDLTLEMFAGRLSTRVDPALALPVPRAVSIIDLEEARQRHLRPLPQRSWPPPYAEILH